MLFIRKNMIYFLFLLLEISSNFVHSQLIIPNSSQYTNSCVSILNNIDNTSCTMYKNCKICKIYVPPSVQRYCPNTERCYPITNDCPIDIYHYLRGCLWANTIFNIAFGLAYSMLFLFSLKRFIRKIKYITDDERIVIKSSILYIACFYVAPLTIFICRVMYYLEIIISLGIFITLIAVCCFREENPISESYVNPNYNSITENNNLHSINTIPSNSRLLF